MGNSYSTNSDIRGDLKGSPSFTTETDVKDASLNDFRDQAYSEINSYLAYKYTLPISDTEDLKFLKKIEIDLVVYRFWKVKNITNQKDIISGAGYQESREYICYKESKRMLEDLKDGSHKLQNTDFASDAILPQECQVDEGVFDKNETVW